jgi:carbon storage regulator
LLTLTRKIGESIRIGDDIVVVIKEIKGKQVRIGIEAPRDVYVCREELFMKIKQANESALAPDQGEAPPPSSDAIAALSQIFLARHEPQNDSQRDQSGDLSHNQEVK